MSIKLGSKNIVDVKKGGVSVPSAKFRGVELLSSPLEVLYETNFTEYAGLSNIYNSADWSSIWTAQSMPVQSTEANLYGTHWLYKISSVDRDTAYVVDAAGELQDAEVLNITFDSGGLPAGTARNRLMVRASGDSASRTAYMLELDSNGTVASLHIRKYLNNVKTTLASVNLPTLDSTYWMRFQVIGNVLKGKHWVQGDPEPETWTLGDDGSITDDDISIGKVGFGNFEGNGTRTWDYIAISNGLEIPLP